MSAVEQKSAETVGVKELNVVIDSEEVMELEDDARTRECLLSSPR